MTESRDVPQAPPERTAASNERRHRWDSRIEGMAPGFLRDLNLPPVRVDDDSSGTYFTLEPRKEIVLGTKHLEDFGFNPAEQAWIKLHELAHIVQYKEDPEAYQGSFADAKERAFADTGLTPEEIDQFLEDYQEGKDVSEYGVTEEHLIKYMVWRRAWNIVMDIHANNIVERRSVVFHPKSELGGLPEQIYREHLFPPEEPVEPEQKELLEKLGVKKEQPRSVQFIDALIRQAMMPEEPLNVSEEVQAELEATVKFLGDDYHGMQAFIDRYIDHDIEFGHMSFAFRNKIAPVIERLLREDLKDHPDPKEYELPKWKHKQGKGESGAERKQGPKGAGEDEEKADEGDERVDFGGTMLPELDPTDADNFVEIDEFTDESKRGASDRARDHERRRFKERLEKKGVDQKDIDEMWERRRRVEEVIRDLKSFWESLIGRSVLRGLQQEAGFKTGAAIDPRSLIRDLPQLFTNPERARVFRRSVVEKGGANFIPKKIRVVKVVDASGSMFTGGEEKIRAAKDVEYAIAQSLIYFARESRDLTEEDFPVEVLLGLVTFGTVAYDQWTGESLHEGVPTFLDVEGGIQEEDEVLEAVLGLNEGQGQTHNEWVYESLLRLVESGEVDPEEELIIVLEVTDGVSHEPEKVRKATQELIKKGVHCKSIQISKGLQADAKERFFKIWDADDGKQLDMLEELLPVCRDLFAEILLNR
jgi:hypothetical protein